MGDTWNEQKTNIQNIMKNDLSCIEEELEWVTVGKGNAYPSCNFIRIQNRNGTTIPNT